MDLRYTGSSAVRDLTAIWHYVCACFCAGGHTDLRSCMFECRRRHRLTCLRSAAPAIIGLYFYVFQSVVGEVSNRNPSVA